MARAVFRLTNLANHLVVLQDTPGNVHTVIVPVGPGHVLVDIGIDARHGDGGWEAGSGSAHNRISIEIKSGGVERGARRRRREGELRGEMDRQQQLQDQEWRGPVSRRQPCYRPSKRWAASIVFGDGDQNG